MSGNLLTHVRVLRYQDDAASDRHPVQWSAPKVAILTSNSESELSKKVNVLLEQPGIQLVGVSPAAVSHSEDWLTFAVTVCYQQRLLTPNGAPDEEEAEGGGE